jgi:K+-sensing histidine kinase KdpD
MYAIRCPTATSPFPYFILKVLSPLAYNVFLVAPRVHFVDTSNGDAPLDAIIVAFLIIATSGVLQSILWRTMSTFVLVEYVCREEETEQPNRE